MREGCCGRAAAARRAARRCGAKHRERGAHLPRQREPLIRTGAALAKPSARWQLPPLASRAAAAGPSPHAGLFAGAALGISAIDQPAQLDDDPSGKGAAKRFSAM